MKNLHTLALLAAGLLLTVSSCTKDKEPTPTTPTTPTTTTPTSPTAPTPTVAGVHGAMVAVQTDFAYTMMGQTIPLNTEMAVAAFWTNVGDANMVDAGAVSINGKALTKNANNSYTVVAGIPNQDPATLELDGDISWNVAGNSTTGVQGHTYNISSTVYPFPTYTQTIPTDITKANGLVLNFTSTTTGNADSVYVVIISGSQSFMKAYKGNAGNVTITASDLNALPASSSTSLAYIEIVPWRVVGYQTLMGKTYAYVNEKAIIRTINLN